MHSADRHYIAEFGLHLLTQTPDRTLFQAPWGSQGASPSCCQELTAGLGRAGLAHRHELQAACGKQGSGAASGLGRVLRSGVGDKSLDLSSSVWSKKGLESTLSVAAQFRQSGLRPESCAGVGRWGWAKRLGGWLGGGRGSGWSCLSRPPLVAHVGADPLPAGKSQTQRSDIWEALGSQSIFRRPEADMPGILGVTEPKKL